MRWTLKKFSELTVDELHDLLQLRINIFVVEQDCPYPELDGKDKMAYHYFATDDEGQIVAYTRIFAPGAYYKEAAIGRVVVEASKRREGLGYDLMQGSISAVRNLFGTDKIKIGAQKYLRSFYESLGFVKIGKGYLEDGIPHIHMVRNGQGHAA